MIGAEGEVLYVGKARSIRKRIAAYTAPERQPSRIARMVSQTRSMVFVTTEIGSRGAAARGQPHQAAEAPLQRRAARRQELPLHPDLHRPPRSPAHQAPRRPLDPGRLFRPVRQRGRGVPHDERDAARLSAAHLLRQLFRAPDPALPPLPDQALLGALHRRDRARRLCRPGRAGAGLSFRPQPGDPAKARQ